MWRRGRYSKNNLLITHHYLGRTGLRSPTQTIAPQRYARLLKPTSCRHSSTMSAPPRCLNRQSAVLCVRRGGLSRTCRPPAADMQCWQGRPEAIHSHCGTGTRRSARGGHHSALSAVSRWSVASEPAPDAPPQHRSRDDVPARVRHTRRQQRYRRE